MSLKHQNLKNNPSNVSKKFLEIKKHNFSQTFKNTIEKLKVNRIFRKEYDLIESEYFGIENDGINNIDPTTLDFKDISIKIPIFKKIKNKKLKAQIDFFSEEFE